ncbi:hypothetical protein HAX54_028184, partial [Datura stramonium]|nr:hypothetical protein [Datura stramonium]
MKRWCWGLCCFSADLRGANGGDFGSGSQMRKKGGFQRRRGSYVEGSAMVPFPMRVKKERVVCLVRGERREGAAANGVAGGDTTEGGQRGRKWERGGCSL